MQVLVDTSVWITYFRGEKKAGFLDALLEKGLVTTNELILTEILPFLRQKEKNAAELFSEIPQVPFTPNWEKIRKIQEKNIKNGINAVGIPDLIIWTHVLESDQVIWTFDKHFFLMAEQQKKKEKIFTP